jgi:4-hydroxy-tetrahydrodipicolinate synthase
MALTTETLQGLWAGLPVPWNARDEVDEDALRENVRRVCQAGAHGVYTHGTTGEFYAQTVEEWQLVARATVEECRKLGTLSQVGCTALWTGEVLARTGN